MYEYVCVRVGPFTRGVILFEYVCLYVCMYVYTYMCAYIERATHIRTHTKMEFLVGLKLRMSTRCNTCVTEV